MKLRSGFIIIFSVILLVSIVGTVFFWPHTLSTPLGTHPQFQFLPTVSEPVSSDAPAKIVYGFLPYWNINKVTPQPELTHLSYFSLTIGKNGEILTKDSDGALDLGYHRLKSEELLQLTSDALKQGKKVEIVLTQFDNDDIEGFLQNPSAYKKLFTNLDAILLAYPFQGVNIDIEYSREVSPALRQSLTNFMQALHTHLKNRRSRIMLSIDMYAGAGENQQLWDVKGLEPYLDYIIVMSYDFHRKSSPVAGPVAPLFGGQKLWDSDVIQRLRKFVEQVPSQKILLGVPFYGYEWRTTSFDPQSTTYQNTGAVASFQRVQQLLMNQTPYQVTSHWNEDALSPYLTYEVQGKKYLIYYENSRSLSYKLDLVQQLQLGGIAIWALGYEQQDRELWDSIHRKLEPAVQAK